MWTRCEFDGMKRRSYTIFDSRAPVWGCRSGSVWNTRVGSVGRSLMNEKSWKNRFKISSSYTIFLLYV